MQLSENERKVLHWLQDAAGLDYCFSFAPIAAGTSLDMKDVRTACRALSQKGLVQFSRGLSDDDGKMAGSGYGLTPKGCEENIA